MPVNDTGSNRKENKKASQKRHLPNALTCLCILIQNNNVDVFQTLGNMKASFVHIYCKGVKSIKFSRNEREKQKRIGIKERRESGQ